MLAVIAYHFGILGASGGFLGVDLFFVLSGFLITSLLVREQRTSGTIRFRNFWARRLRRLLPASLAMVVAVAIWATVVLDPISLHSIRYDLLAVLGYVANWRFIASGQSYFGLFTESSPVRHAWSLAIEEQFYMAWPVVAFAFLRLRRRGEAALLSLSLAGVVGSTALMWHLFRHDDPSRAYYGTDTRAAQLLVGVVCALLVASRKNPMPSKHARQLSSIACVAVLAAFFLITDGSAAMYHGGFLAFAVVAGILVVSTVDSTSGPLHSLLTSRPVTYIGRISYGLYLWHWPVSIAVSEMHAPLQGSTLAAARIAVTFAVAVLSFHLLESPIRYGTGWANVRTRTTVAGALTAFAVSATVAVVATARSEAPPDYLTARQDAVLLTDNTTTDVNSLRMLLVGDSIAGSLQKALSVEAASRSLQFFARTRPGCGLTTGLPATSKGDLYSWSHTCADSTLDYLTRMVMGTSPDVVLWLSSWEVSPRIVNGKLFTKNDPGFDDEVLREIDASVKILTSNGARVFFLTVAARARTSQIAEGSADNAHSAEHLNGIFRAYASAHPESTSVIDLAKLVCPTMYPCEPQVDGITLRPRDGGHFGPEGSAWVAPRLFDLIVQRATRGS